MKARSSAFRVLSILMLASIVVSALPVTSLAADLPLAELEAGLASSGQAAVGGETIVPWPAPSEGMNRQRPGVTMETPWTFLTAAANERKSISGPMEDTPTYNPLPSPLLVPQPGKDYLFVAFGPAETVPNRRGVMRYDGSNWAWVRDGLGPDDAKKVTAMAVDWSNPTTLLISTYDGIYRTTDVLGSCYWDQVLDVPNITTIEAHPVVSGTFFATTKPMTPMVGDDCPGQGTDCSRFYKSTDWGETWSTPVYLPNPTTTGNAPADICVWVDPQGENDDVVYIPNFNTAVSDPQLQYFWRSMDGTDSFTNVRTLPFRAQHCAVEPISVEPISNVVYMGGVGGLQFAYRAAKSTDQGESWVNIAPSEYDFLDLGVSPYSADNGQVWMTEGRQGNDRIWESDAPVSTSTWEPITVTFPYAGDYPRALDFGLPDEVWVVGDARKVFHVTAGQNGWETDTLASIPYSLTPGTTAPVPADIVSLGQYYYPISASLFAQVDVSPVITRADGQSSVAVTVTVQNYTGTAVPSVTVAITDSGAGLDITQPVSATDSDGQTVGYVKGSVDKVAYLSAQATEIDLSNAARVEFVGPDLRLAKQAPVTVTAGMNITYTIWITNVGWAPAHHVVVTDTLSPYVEYITQSSSFTTTYNPSAGTVIWELGDLAEDEVVSWTVTVQVSGTVLTNTVVAHTDDVEHNGQEGNEATARTLALNYLVATPDEPTLGTALWKSDSLTITVQNLGEDPLHTLTVALPSSMGGWLTGDYAGMADELDQGQQTVFTVTASPTITSLKGYHQGYIEIESAEGTKAYVALTVFVGDGISGTAEFTVTEAVSSTAVGNAQFTAVWVGEEISGTDWLIFQGQTDAAGRLTFPGIPAGAYYYQVRKPGLISTWGQFDIQGGQTSGINVSMGVQYAWWEWYVGEGSISDTYDLILTITYRLRNEPLLVHCGPWLEVPLGNGTSYSGLLTLENPTAYGLSSVTVDTSRLVPGFAMSFENNGHITIDARTATSIPFTATASSPIVEGDYEAGALQIVGDYVSGTVSLTYAMSLNVLVNPIRGLNCHCVTDPEYFRTYCSREGMPCGDGGCGGGWAPPPFQPPPWEPPQQLPGAPGHAQLVMSQPAALTRQAFWAKLTIGNGGVLPITGVDIDLVIKDAQGLTETGFFTDSSQARWTYVPPGVSRMWQWMLVPGACLGGDDPAGQDYFIHARGTFRMGAETHVFTTGAGMLTVIPQPRLFLSYYWPAEVEIFDPFQVLVAVRNWAHGPAANFRMKTPTWQVMGPPGAQVALVTSTLDLGTVGPQEIAVGSMDFIPNYTGAITDVHVSLSHRPFQGIELNPLVLSMTAFLVYSDHVTLVGGAGLEDPGAGCAPPPPVPGPGLLWVKAPRADVGMPGHSTVYTYTVLNMSGMAVTSTLVVTSSHGWATDVSGPVQIAPGGRIEVPVTLTVPSTATMGTIDTLTLQAARQDLPQIRAHDWTRILVSNLPEYGLILDPRAAAFQVQDGRYVPLDLPVVVTLTNNTVISATSATVSIPTWLALTPGQEPVQVISGVLSPGQSGVVSWTVRPPTAAQEVTATLEYPVYATAPEHVATYATGIITVPAIMTQIEMSLIELVRAPTQTDPFSDSLYIDYTFSVTAEPPDNPWTAEKNPVTVTVAVTNIGGITAVTLVVTLDTPAGIMVTPTTEVSQVVASLPPSATARLLWNLIPSTAQPLQAWSRPISATAAAWNAHPQTGAGQVPIRRSYESGYLITEHDTFRWENALPVTNPMRLPESLDYEPTYHLAFAETDPDERNLFWDLALEIPALENFVSDWFRMGHCAGFVSANGTLFASPPGTRPAQPLENIADWNGLSCADFPWGLLDTETYRMVRMYHWRNLSAEVWREVIGHYAQLSLGYIDNGTVYSTITAELLDKMEDPRALLLGPEGIPLCDPSLPNCQQEWATWRQVRQRTHQVLPYKLVYTEGRCEIHVYESNEPGAPGYAIELDISPEDPSDWSYRYLYPSNPGFGAPYSTANDSALLWTDVGVWYSGTHLFTDLYGFLGVSGDSTSPAILGIADPEGRILGPVGDRAGLEIPDAGPLPMGGQLGYAVPKGGDYSAVVTGYGSGTYTLTGIHEGNVFLLQNMAVVTGTEDVLSITQGFASYTLTTTDSMKTFTTTLTHLYTDTGRARTSAISNTALAAGEAATFAYDGSADLFHYTNVGGTRTYGLRLEQLQAISDGEFSAITTVVALPGIAMGANETHFFAVEDWDHLPTSTIRLLVDQGNDGTIDEVRVLQDKELPFSEATSLPYANVAPITVTFVASDTVSGVAYTELWARTPPTTTWVTTGLALTGTSGVFVYAPAAGDGNYYFAAVAVDNAGNHEAAPEGSGDTATVYDTAPPSSQVAALPAYSMGTFTVTWGGGDTTSGVASYDVWYRIDKNDWVEWLFQVTQTQALFHGNQEGCPHYFACRAYDRAGNVEEWPDDPDYDTVTTLDLTPPASSAVSPDYDTGGSIPVSWTAADELAGLASTELWVRTPPTTTWMASGLVLTGTSGVFAYTPTAGDGTYHFATVAVDNAGNREASPVGVGDDSTIYDTTPPSSQVAALPAYSLATFTVTWSGSDPLSGLQDYDVQVCSIDCLSGWSDWLTHTTATTHAFTGSHGITYSFRSRARDHAGNVEPWPAGADTVTTVDTAPPETAVDAMPTYYTTTTFSVSWQGADDLSGIDHYDLYYATESAADWSLWLAGLTTTQTLFTGTRGYTYHFCSQGVDNLGNAEHCLPTCIGGPPCWPIQSDAHTGVTPWSRVNDLPAYTGSRTFTVSWSGGPPQPVQGPPLYNVQVRDGIYGWWLPWKSGVMYTSADYTGQYGHIYYFRCQQQAWGLWELYPLGYDTYTKLVAPTEGEGAAGGGSKLALLPPDEAPDRMEDVTRTQTLGMLTGYIAPADDVDWYRFELTATKRLRVTLADLPADFDVYVFDGSGQFLWASTWGRRLPEEVVVRVPAGVYYVQLVGYAGDWSGELPYRLAVDVVGGGGQGGAPGSMGGPGGAPVPW